MSVKYPFGEYRVVCVRERAPTRAVTVETGARDARNINTPDDAAEYWHQFIASDARFDPEVEHLYVIFLNSRNKAKGHSLVSKGTLDSTLAHPREVFRAAIVAAAAKVILMHNHPSGDTSPSEADIKTTRDMVRAGQLLRIALEDHVIVGPSRDNRRCSLRESGFFYHP